MSDEWWNDYNRLYQRVADREEEKENIIDTGMPSLPVQKHPNEPYEHYVPDTEE